MAAHDLDIDVPQAAGPAGSNAPLSAVRYQIDAQDRIVAVSETWAAFAVANDSPHLSEGVLGRSLWDFVGDTPTRELYQVLLARVRGGRPVRFPYRCDAPAMRRFMRMTMTLTNGGGVCFDSAILRAEPRTPQWSAPALPAGPAALLTACGWCNRIAVAGGWEEIEVAIDRLGLFGAAPPPALTHGICPACYGSFVAALDTAG